MAFYICYPSFQNLLYLSMSTLLQILHMTEFHLLQASHLRINSKVAIQACVSEKIPETLQARKPNLCAGVLLTEIQFSFVLKDKRKKS